MPGRTNMPPPPRPQPGIRRQIAPNRNTTRRQAIIRSINARNPPIPPTATPLPVNTYTMALTTARMAYIANVNHPEGAYIHGTIPSYINRHPATLKPPNNPLSRLSTLSLLPPVIFYVQYACEEQCRSYGICIHYQLILGCRKTPDDLICNRCSDGVGLQDKIVVERSCPLHQNAETARPISSMPEDFLASREQKEMAEEIMRRSVCNDWDDLRGQGTVEGGQNDAVNERML